MRTRALPLLALAVATIAVIATSPAEARHRQRTHHYHHYHHYHHHAHHYHHHAKRRSHVRRARPTWGTTTVSFRGVVVGSRPRGCPHAFCGCEASLYLFGRIRPELNLALNWMRFFSRAAPAPGMAAVRRHHVMVLMRHLGGSLWLAHDGNSGGGRTREHVVSIAGYVIVDPRSSQTAMTD